MRRTNYLICAAVAATVTFAGTARGADRGDHDWYSVKVEQTIRNSYTLPAGKRNVTVDNVFGSIEVTAAKGDQVQMVVTEIFRAESQDKLIQAKKEVSLDVTNENGELKLYVNGPFRCHCSDGWGDDSHKGYVVEMNFKLEVPNNTDIALSTVNDGNIRVNGVSGDYRVRNVNGSIDITDAAGSGIVKTINGHVNVSFRENPKQDSQFSSLNGDVVLNFAQNLSADFRFKNMNGGVYTDYEMTALAPKQATEDRRSGHFVYRSDRFTGGRVGSGGPEIKVENLNGAIRILQRHA